MPICIKLFVNNHYLSTIQENIIKESKKYYVVHGIFCIFVYPYDIFLIKKLIKKVCST
jgi:hypothetical protein